MENIYGLNFSVKSFAVANEFVTNTNKVCYTLGQKLKPFCIYGSDKQKKAGVLDFADFNGIVDESRNLVEEIAEYRAGVLRDSGIYTDLTSSSKNKFLFFNYLMTISMCYVEIPKYVTKNAMPTHTYDKFFCTRNPNIMAAWMGISTSEAQTKYSSRITLNQCDLESGEIKLVKLNSTAKGNTITVPRSTFSIENMVCIPVYMLYAFIEGFKPHLNDKLLKFSYLKDNDSVRDLVSTLDAELLNSIYHDTNFVSQMLSGVDINSVKQGGMVLSSKMNRGYIKVPEVGSSIYDSTGCRSLNIARLLSIQEVHKSDIDLSYIKVDLDSVLTNFRESLEYAMLKFPDKLLSIHDALIQSENEKTVSSTDATYLISDMISYTERMATILSTTYLRSLHKFMISNPEWFPTYLGTPSHNIISSKGLGVSEDFDF